MMNPFVKQFLLRGMLFGGFGPLIAGVVYWILSYSLPDFTLTGGQVFLAIFSTYLLGFVQAGASIFNQMEHWPLAKSLLCHFSTVYTAYVLCYLVNDWIPFDARVLLMFTAIFAATYLIIWLTIFLITRRMEKRLNQQLDVE